MPWASVGVDTKWNKNRFNHRNLGNFSVGLYMTDYKDESIYFVLAANPHRSLRLRGNLANKRSHEEPGVIPKVCPYYANEL